MIYSDAGSRSARRQIVFLVICLKAPKGSHQRRLCRDTETEVCRAHKPGARRALAPLTDFSLCLKQSTTCKRGTFRHHVQSSPGCCSSSLSRQRINSHLQVMKTRVYIQRGALHIMRDTPPSLIVKSGSVGLHTLQLEVWLQGSSSSKFRLKKLEWPTSQNATLGPKSYSVSLQARWRNLELTWILSLWPAVLHLHPFYQAERTNRGRTHSHVQD